MNPKLPTQSLQRSNTNSPLLASQPQGYSQQQKFNKIPPTSQSQSQSPTHAAGQLQTSKMYNKHGSNITPSNLKGPKFTPANNNQIGGSLPNRK